MISLKYVHGDDTGHTFYIFYVSLSLIYIYITLPRQNKKIADKMNTIAHYSLHDSRESKV